MKTDTVRLTESEVPWRQIAGIRDKIVHEYFGLNLDLVWGVVERDLPVLTRVVDELLRTDRAPDADVQG